MVNGFLADMVAMVANALHVHIPNGQQGVVVGGSYNAAESKAQIQVGDTAGITDDGDDIPIWRPDIPLLTHHVGDQYGPAGNERAVMLESTSGPVMAFIHGPDDSPQAPSGERWIAHRNANGEIDSFTKFTNDGPTQGDGLGGVLQNGGAIHRLTTSGGHTIEENDTAKTVKVTSAGGHVITVDDNQDTKGVTIQTAGGLLGHFDDVAQQIKHQASDTVYTLVNGNGDAIAHVASKFAAGDLFSNLDATRAMVANADVESFKDSIMADMMQSFAGVYATAMESAGVPGASNLYGIVTALNWVIKNVTPPTVPAGSSIARVAP